MHKDSLVGSILIASPYMTDNRFKRAIILITEAKTSGIFGLVINGHVLYDLKNEKKTQHVYWGGPIDEHKIIALHTKEHDLPGSLNIEGDVMLSNIKEIESETINGKYIFIAGHSVWQLKQFEKELMTGMWFLHHSAGDIIFSKNHDKWKHCLKLLNIDTISRSCVVGNA